MVYVPGSHRRGLLTHERVTSGDGSERRILAVVARDAYEATVKQGGAALHLPRTIHMARPNDSNDARLAWIIQVGVGSPAFDSARFNFRQWLVRRIGLGRSPAAGA